MLSVKQDASSTIFWVYGMTRPEIEPLSPRPLAFLKILFLYLFYNSGGVKKKQIIQFASKKIVGEKKFH